MHYSLSRLIWRIGSKRGSPGQQDFKTKKAKEAPTGDAAYTTKPSTCQGKTTIKRSSMQYNHLKLYLKDISHLHKSSTLHTLRVFYTKYKVVFKK
jgi:hypothetical protein